MFLALQSHCSNIVRAADNTRPGGTEEPILEVDLQPGQMAVFDDAPVRHRVTPIQVSGGRTGGHRDVVLMSYGGQLTV